MLDIVRPSSSRSIITVAEGSISGRAEKYGTAIRGCRAAHPGRPAAHVHLRLVRRHPARPGAREELRQHRHRQRQRHRPVFCKGDRLIILHMSHDNIVDNLFANWVGQPLGVWLKKWKCCWWFQELRDTERHRGGRDFVVHEARVLQFARTVPVTSPARVVGRPTEPKHNYSRPASSNTPRAWSFNRNHTSVDHFLNSIMLLRACTYLEEKSGTCYNWLLSDLLLDSIILNFIP